MSISVRRGGGGGDIVLDQDLTDIAGLAPTDDDLLQRKSGAWASRTPAQIKTDLALSAADAGAQPADADLTAIAGLSPSDDDFIQRKSGAWTSRTPAQVAADLGVTAGGGSFASTFKWGVD